MRSRGKYSMKFYENYDFNKKYLYKYYYNKFSIVNNL